MRYLVFGAGGVGGILACVLAESGRDVTVIARGAHLQAIREKGLTLTRTYNNTEDTFRIPAMTSEEYKDTPDVVLLCVKDYSMAAAAPFLKRICGPETVVIPILNIVGTGGKLQKELPGIHVMDGCIYIAGKLAGPGHLIRFKAILKLVFGPRTPEEAVPRLPAIAADLEAAGIHTILSDNILRDHFIKFSFVSPMGAAGVYYDAPAAAFQVPGEARDFLLALMQDIYNLTDAMGLHFPPEVHPDNLSRLAATPAGGTTSMQRDIAEGKPSEIDGQVYEVLRLAEQYHVSVPAYEKAAAKFREMGL